VVAGFAITLFGEYADYKDAGPDPRCNKNVVLDDCNENFATWT
jgi:hypothetical protein